MRALLPYGLLACLFVEVLADYIDSISPVAPNPDLEGQTWIDSYPSSIRRSWSLPPTFVDMSPFNVSSFASGATNLAVLRGSPAEVHWQSVDYQAAFSSDQGIGWNDSTNCVQILYPKGSNAPHNQPQGGTEFYARPLDMSTENNGSLQYSVYFPADFDWVKGGKLPGLYGGHKECSGGNAAVDCFSTRLMWRANGDGELYLYVPKDKQTPGLCSLPPKSVCDSNYGLSIGRGAWRFARGGWTTIRQDIWLNTPGVNDGGFNIWVNGQLVLSYNQVRYRENAGGCEPQQQAVESPIMPSGSDPVEATQTSSDLIEPTGSSGESATISATNATPEVGKQAVDPQPTISDDSITTAPSVIKRDEYPWDSSLWQVSPTTPIEPATASLTSGPADVYPFRKIKVGHGPHPPSSDCAVGLIGFFFSTFYGGHTADWSPASDEYTYFKDFQMRVNG